MSPIDQREAIADAGRNAAQARRRGDEACAQFHTDWARRAARLDKDEREARRVFDDAYRQWNEEHPRR